MAWGNLIGMPAQPNLPSLHVAVIELGSSEAGQPLTAQEYEAKRNALIP